ncbi:signal peptide containing protein, putative [Babesia ovata]|uniref:Signal peptide containing protein, putative n=1 Tax=Babesia ovata TaxID=189622 RepID=A0A2H6KC39_9APIC|nr:signal peptide containing protein, putative [Babesia ovata]GBE60555.1 signal peptide containing protein, putative [Babesia ovata]
MVRIWLLGLALLTCAGAVEQGPGPEALVELLDKPTANKDLILTIVECLEGPPGKITMVAFVRCINNRLHIHHRTKLDSIGFILGNFITKAMFKFTLVEEEDLFERTAVFGDCLPMLLRNLVSMHEFSFSCKKRVFIEGYDDPDDSEFDDDEDE